MANSTTGDGSYSPNIVAGIGDTGTVSIDTGPLDANYLIAGSAMAGDGDGAITITGDNGVVNVADPALYAYSRLTVGSGYGPYSGTGVLNIDNGGSLTSTNNAALASGSIPLGGYSNLVVGSGPNSMGTVNVDGVGTFGSSVLGLYGGSAGFILGVDSGDGTINVTNGAQFFTLTGVVGAGDTSGGVYPGGTGTISVIGMGSEFIATTNNGNFLVDSDQAPVIFVGQNDGTGYLGADSYGLITIQNEVGDGKSSPTLVFGDDLNSIGGGGINNSAILNIIQYDAANSGNRLNGNSGLIVGNAGVGQLGADGDSAINVLGDRANLVVSVGSYDGQGAPIAPLGQSQLTLYYAAVATIDSQGYGGANGSQVTVGAQRLSDGRILVSQDATLNVLSATDLVGDYTTGRIVIGDLGNGTLSAGRRGYVNASELIVGGRGYIASPLDNSTDQTFTGYNAAADGGGAGLLELTANGAQIVITATDATPDRGITLGQASGTTGELTIEDPFTGVSTDSYVKSTGGLGSIIIGEYGTGVATITGGGALYGGFITVGVGTTASVDSLTITGAGSKTVASGAYTNVLFGGVNNGQSAVVEVGRQDGSYGLLVVNSGGELEVTNVDGVNQNPTLLIATEDDSYGRAQIDGAGSAINITQNGARFLAPSGDTFGGAEAIIGRVGYANVDVTNNAQINVLGDSALLSVGDGGYDGMGVPILSTVESNLTIASGADVLVDSQTFGFDQSAGDYSEGSAVYVGRGVGGYGRIVVSDANSSLTVTSSSDFVGDYKTGGIIVGDLGRGALDIAGANNGFGPTTDVTARSLTIGLTSFYDDGSGRQYGGYLPNVTAAGSGVVTLTGASNVALIATENTPARGLTIGRDSGTTGSLSIGTYGSLTSQGGEGKIVVGDLGTGTLTLNDGAAVSGFSLDIGRGEGSDGDVVVSGYDMLAGAFSQITLSNEFGDFSGQPGDNGRAGLLRIGLDDGSEGSLTVSDGGIVNVINQNGTTYDAPTVKIGLENGAVGALTVDGFYSMGSLYYYSTLSITQTGNIGDFVASGGIGPVGPTLTVGEGGQGIAEITNGGQVLVQGAAAALNVSAGRFDAAGNPDTTTDQSELNIRSGAYVLIDSQSYGGTQTFTDDAGNPVTAALGAQVIVGGAEGTDGLIRVYDAGSTLTVQSASSVVGDYETGRILVGANGGQGNIFAANGGAINARTLQLGDGAGSSGSTTLFNSTATLTATDDARYLGAIVGSDGGTGFLTVRMGSDLTSTGGAGQILVGDRGFGNLGINTGGEAFGFLGLVGRGAGSNGNVTIDGDGSRLVFSDAYGSFDPANVAGPLGGTLVVGLENGGDGYIQVIGGGDLSVINDYMAPPNLQGDGASLTIGRDAGALGAVTISGDDGMGNRSYLRVQSYGRANDAYMPGEYVGPEIVLGQNGGGGQLLVEQNGIAVVAGEGASLIIGQGIEGGDSSAEPTSLVSVTSGSLLAIDSVPSPDFSLAYNAAALIAVGDETGGNGRLLVTGAGSTVTIESDNDANYYANGDLALGAGLEIGALGRGVLDVLDGGQILIDGADDAFPRLTIGYGENGPAINASGDATVDGAGSRIDIIGTAGSLGPNYNFGAAGAINVGANDGAMGRLTISDGGVVANTAVNSTTQIAQSLGSMGDIIVTGAGSTLDAGARLAVGAGVDLVTGAFIDNQSGAGTLTIDDGGIVNAFSTFVGSSGVLSIRDASMGGDLEVTGAFFVGGSDSIGDVTLLNTFSQTSGLLEFEVAGVNAGEFDTIVLGDDVTLSGDAIMIDVDNLANLNVGDSAVLLSTINAINIDTTQTVSFIGQAAGPGREFVLTQEFDPLGQSGPVDQLVFSVQQGTLTIVTGDFEIISPADGQVALTTADVSIVEGGVDPALQTLTAANVSGGQLESALNPGVAITSFSQQDVDDRLIRFVSDGTSGGGFNLGFTDSVGFADSVSISVNPVGAPDINLGDLDGANGVTLNGILAGDQAGLGVSDIGDINNDGIADIAVGASFADTSRGPDTGEGYVIFGVDGGLPASFELSSLDGSNGFTFEGLGPSQLTGVNGSVEGVGDVNNDGIDDFIIGIGGVDTGGMFNVGEAFLIYGDAAGFGANLDLGNLDGSNGTRLVGIDVNSLTGQTVPGLGDVNGDGINDFGISASFGDGAAGVDSGESFVVFGVDGGLGATLQLSDLDGSNGFRLEGDAAGDNAGVIGRIGDFNNDGIDDFLVGAPNNDNANGANTGNVQIIFGATGPQSAVRQLNSITPAEGFRILGLEVDDSLGGSVSDGGDINGDGIDDLIITSKTADVGGIVDVGTTYVIFGTADDFAGSFDLSTLDGSNGFSVSGSFANQRAGYTSASAGDVNGDGVDDLIIGGIGAPPGGEVYIIFGSTDPFSATVALDSLNGETGFTVTAADPADALGRDVSTAGDFNNDGITDILVGANTGDPGERINAGEAYVIYGAVGAVAEAPVITGDLRLEAPQGQSGAITTADLSASESGAVPADLLYHVTNAVGGFVAAFDAPGAPITTFTQADVDAGQVVFSNDAGTELGSFDVTVTDLDGDVGGPVTVAVQSTVGANSFNLSDLDGINGFQLNGVAAGDLSGLAVSNAGDINGDGFDDVIVGAPEADGGGINSSGETYIVFGAAGGFAPQIELSSLDGTNGFRLTGTASGDLSGGTVSAAGDVNNDGFDDLLVGIRNADRPSFNEGEVIVLYGGSTPFPASRALTGFDGTDGTVINGADFNSLTGASLSEAGDINGDGIDDFIIGSAFGDTGAGVDAGESYIVFGADGGLGANFNLTTLDGSNGFRVEGDAPNARVGTVSGLGDINNDGFDDFAVGSQVADPASGADAGQTFVFFGGPTANPVISVGDLNGTNGFRVDGLVAGDQSARSLSAAGDINNDGIDDFLISAFSADPNGVTDAGSVYVVFGQAGGPTGGGATFDLGSLDGANGFVIEGVDANDRTGYSISGIGDFDGDGISDILISADAGDPFDVAGAGEAYIVFGQEGGFDAALNLSSLDGVNGLRLNGILTGDNTGRDLSAAGDVNNDGRDDIIIGAFTADPNGLTSAGQSYVVFGFGPNQPPIARDDNFLVIADTPFSGDLFADNGDDIDEDVDGDPFDLISVNGSGMQVGAPVILPSSALVQVQPNGLFDYAANGAFDILAAGELGADVFTYTIGNAGGEMSTATVNLTIEGVNDAPFAFDDALSVSEDDDLAGSVFVNNGLGADFDIDNGSVISVLSINNSRLDVGQPVTLAGGGQITLNDDGTFQFATLNAYEALAEGETTTEIFTYTIDDGLGGSATATVNLDITGANDAPVAQDDEIAIFEGDAASFNVIDDNGGGIDSDIDNVAFRISGANGQAVPDGGSINFFTATGLAVTIDSTGALTVNAASPALNALGEGEQLADSFVYQLQDELGATDTAEVNFAIMGVNDAPTAANDLIRTDERTAIAASIFADNGAGPDRDVDGAFTVASVNGDSALVGTEIMLPSGALLTITADGAATFDPNGAFTALSAGEQGIEQVTYTISDDQGATDQATIVFTVDGVVDTIFGSSGDDLIRGTDEADEIDGLAGNDLITGLAGNDTIMGGPGLDIIRGGADDDILVGGPDKDRLFGEAGDDQLNGGGGGDRLLGLAGNDTINGNAGDDVLSGGRGNDLVFGQDGDDRLRGGRDSDTLIAGDGKDRLQGGTGDDSLFGQAGNDNLTGAGGADTLSGGDGLDRLFGRRGNDELTGGQGSDRFIFNLGDGNDTITDFEQGADRIRIASGADSFADLTITQVGDDALIAFGNVRILALEEDATDFTSADFVL